jgi:AcrR family transcriptional regulator
MTRPLRKDAALRRTALLQAAAELFEKEGIDTPLDRIAEHAGVGRATLYRNFSGRTDLALAVLAVEFEDLGERFAADETPDVFLHFLTRLSVILDRNTALRGVVRAASTPDILEPLRVALARAAASPLRVSQAAGVVRSDIKPGDLRILASMLSGPLGNTMPAERNSIRRRTLKFVLDSVRASA